MNGVPPTPEALRATFGRYPSGLTVITAVDAGEPVGMTLQAFHALSLDPPLVLLCPARTSTTWPRLERAARLCVNVLAEDQHALARAFARSGTDRFDGVAWTGAPDLGVPVLDGAVAWLACTLERRWMAGDHHIAVCRVRSMGASQGERPLVFFRSAMWSLAATALDQDGNGREETPVQRIETGRSSR